VKKSILLFALSIGILTLSACHSYHVEATVENRTGQPLQLLEVQYPSASFGANSMAAGETLHYRFQILGQGQLKVHYWTGPGHQIETVIPGPDLHEKQEGTLQIILNPNGKADFFTHLNQ
jgi:FKBP-type peptidyl-prolyl cis-trans isomerase 2